MTKLRYSFDHYVWGNYLAHNRFSDTNCGSRISGRYKNINYGAAVIATSINEKKFLKYQYEIDAEYNFRDIISINQQVSLIEEDYKYFGYLIVEKDWSISVLKHIKPYCGYNNDDLAQHAIAGINLTPIDGAFVKIEYNKDIENGTSEQIDLQVGYSF